MRKFENIFIAFYGVVTVIAFLLMILFGGLLDSFHTLVYKEISFLISPHSLRYSLTLPLYQIYNITLLIFALILLVRIPNIIAKLGALYLVGSTIIGILLVHFPMDPLGVGDSLTGKQHILITAIEFLCIIIAILLMRRGFGKKLQWLSGASYIVSILILFAGMLIGIFALFSMREFVGITEKLPIAAFLVWILMTSWGIFRSDKRVHYHFIFPHRKKHKQKRS